MNLLNNIVVDHREDGSKNSKDQQFSLKSNQIISLTKLLNQVITEVKIKKISVNSINFNS